MPRLKLQPKPLRDATTYRSRKSIYAPSVAGSTASLGHRLVVRRLDQKGKQRQVQDEDEDELDELDEDDEVREGMKQEFSERAKRAWETRREAEVRREEERAERLVADDAPDLPSDDLLNALHYYTSEFYTTHSLLLEPYTQSRARQWGSKKRMYLQNEGIAPLEQGKMDKDTWAHLKPIKRRRVMSVPVWAVRDESEGKEDEGDGDGEGGEGGESGESGESGEGEEGEETEDGEDNESLVEGPEVEGSDEQIPEDEEDEDETEFNVDDAAQRVEQDDAEDDNTVALDAPGMGDEEPSSRVRSRYKRRDMYKSMDGTAMLALGFLVERFIASELKKAGYSARIEEPIVNEGDAGDDPNDPDE